MAKTLVASGMIIQVFETIFSKFLSVLFFFFQDITNAPFLCENNTNALNSLYLRITYMRRRVYYGIGTSAFLLYINDFFLLLLVFFITPLTQVPFRCVERALSYFSQSFCLPFWHNCLLACLAGPKSQYFRYRVIFHGPKQFTKIIRDKNQDCAQLPQWVANYFR